MPNPEIAAKLAELDAIHKAAGWEEDCEFCRAPMQAWEPIFNAYPALRRHIDTQAARIAELEGEVQEARSFFGRKRLDNRVPVLMDCITDAYEEISTEHRSLLAEIDRLKRELAAESPMPENLQELLELARGYQMSPEEKCAQIESFAYGNTHMENDKITRAEIREEVESLTSPKLFAQLTAAQAQIATLRGEISGALAVLGTGKCKVEGPCESCEFERQEAVAILQAAMKEPHAD